MAEQAAQRRGALVPAAQTLTVSVRMSTTTYRNHLEPYGMYCANQALAHCKNDVSVLLTCLFDEVVLFRPGLHVVLCAVHQEVYRPMVKGIPQLVRTCMGNMTFAR